MCCEVLASLLRSARMADSLLARGLSHRRPRLPPGHQGRCGCRPARLCLGSRTGSAALIEWGHGHCQARSAGPRGGSHRRQPWAAAKPGTPAGCAAGWAAALARPSARSGIPAAGCAPLQQNHSAGTRSPAAALRPCGRGPAPGSPANLLEPRSWPQRPPQWGHLPPAGHPHAARPARRVPSRCAGRRMPVHRSGSP